MCNKKSNLSGTHLVISPIIELDCRVRYWTELPSECIRNEKWTSMFATDTGHRSNSRNRLERFIRSARASIVQSRRVGCRTSAAAESPGPKSGRAPHFDAAHVRWHARKKPLARQAPRHLSAIAHSSAQWRRRKDRKIERDTKTERQKEKCAEMLTTGGEEEEKGCKREEEGEDGDDDDVAMVERETSKKESKKRLLGSVHGGQSGRCQSANWQPCRIEVARSRFV